MFRQVLVPVKFSVCGRLAAWHACNVVAPSAKRSHCCTYLNILNPDPTNLDTLSKKTSGKPGIRRRSYACGSSVCTPAARPAC